MAAVVAPPSAYSSPMPAPAPAGWRPGTLPPGSIVRVGEHRVTVERFLSEGGFAHVYLVRSTAPIPPSSDSLLHVLKRIAVPDKEALQAVRKEVDIMKALRGNRHIIHFIEATASELPRKAGYEVYILMEYAQGGGIIDMMNTRLENRLTESEILKIFSDTVEAVAHMHQQDPPLLHRDLKVENILLSSPSLYKLCDFGSTTLAMTAPPQSVAEIQALEADLNKNTTLQYRAPEMCDVWSRKPIGLPADVWALGVFLYKLCFYTTPFEEHGMLAIQNAQYKMPAYPAYSSAIRELIASMLQEHAARRPTIEQVHQRVCQMRGVKPKYLPRVAPAKSSSASSAPSNVLDSVIQPGSRISPALPPTSSGPQIAPMRRGRPGEGVRLARTGVATSSEAWDTGAGRTSSPASGFGDAFAPSAASTSAFSPPTASSSPWQTSPPTVPSHPVALASLTKSPELGLPRPASNGNMNAFAGFNDAFTPPPQLRPKPSASANITPQPTLPPSALSPPEPAQSLPLPGPKAFSTSHLALDGKMAEAAAEPPLPARPRPKPKPAALEGKRPELVSRSSQTSPRLVDDWMRSRKEEKGKAPALLSTQIDLLDGEAVDSPTTTSRRDVNGVLATLRDNEEATEAFNEALSAPRTLPSIPAPVDRSSKRISLPVGLSDMAAAQQRYRPTAQPLKSPPLPTKPERLRRPSTRSVESSDDEAVEPVSLPSVVEPIIEPAMSDSPDQPFNLPTLSPQPSLQRSSSATSSSSSRSRSGNGNFDLDRALSSIQKFAPPKPSAPPLQAPKPRAAISNLVSRYETLSASSPPPTSATSRRTPSLGSANGGSPRTPSSTFASRFPSLEEDTQEQRSEAKTKEVERSVSGGAGRRPYQATPPTAAERDVVRNEGGGEEEKAFDGVSAMKARWETKGGGVTRSQSVNTPTSKRRTDWRAV